MDAKSWIQKVDWKMGNVIKTWVPIIAVLLNLCIMIGGGIFIVGKAAGVVEEKMMVYNKELARLQDSKVDKATAEVKWNEFNKDICDLKAGINEINSDVKWVIRYHVTGNPTKK